MMLHQRVAECALWMLETLSFKVGLYTQVMCLTGKDMLSISHWVGSPRMQCFKQNCISDFPKQHFQSQIYTFWPSITLYLLSTLICFDDRKYCFVDCKHSFDINQCIGGWFLPDWIQDFWKVGSYIHV